MCGADLKPLAHLLLLLGSPPRVRSRPPARPDHGAQRGITSACAEQTSNASSNALTWRDHLRVCGADAHYAPAGEAPPGSPPRVRSRLQRQHQLQQGTGITSACAEQTATCSTAASSKGDHLRVCGADNALGAAGVVTLGSPPRVRSRPQRPDLHIGPRGITSACAEQTRAPCPPPARSWDHLRVCGADAPPTSLRMMPLGSPPRVRSRRHQETHVSLAVGITSACAEQTVRGRPSVRRRRDHLRVCGADAAPPLMPLSFLGSPPRVRSRHLGIELPVFIPGITSACAEQTSYDTIFSNCHKDHLRVCGAD